MELSIVIAIYNAEKFLRICLDSVKACPSVNIECIMVNDGSTDGTRAICEEFANADSRFKLINKENSGVSESRNTGMLTATGNYILFLDSDDYLDTGMWPEILERARDMRYDMVAYSYYSLFESGKVEEELYPDCAGEGANSAEHVRNAILSTTLLNPCWGKLLRREIIEKNNLRFRKDLKTCEDAIFIIDFVQNASKFLLLNRCMLFYRIHGNSAMRSINLTAKLKDFTELFRRRKEYLALNYDDAAKTAMYRQSFSIITDLFRGYAVSESIGNSRAAYRESMEEPVVMDIIAGTDKSSLSPFFKKLEYAWMRGGWFTCLALYFKLKSRFVKS